MSLRTKTLLIVAAVVVGTGFLLTVSIGAMMHFSISSLERADAESQTSRVLDAITLDLENLDSIAYDWASWDDSVEFVTGEYPEFPDDNLVDSTFDGLRINGWLYTDNAGDLVYSKGYDLEESAETEVPADLFDHLDAESTLLSGPSGTESVAGVLTLEDGPVLISSRRILSSSDEGPSPGVMIAYRFLDREIAGALSDSARNEFWLLPSDSEEVVSAREDAGNAEDDSILVKAVDADVTAAYSILPDLSPDKSTAVAVYVPRDIFWQGMYVFLAMMGAFALTVLVAGGATTAVFDRFIVRRVEDLSSQVSRITELSDPSERVWVGGNDEIGGLGKSVNTMLASLQVSHAGLREAHVELEARVVERTHALADSEQRYRSLVENLSESVLSLDGEGCIIYASPRAEELTGRKVSVLVGQDFASLVAPESQDAVRGMLKACDETTTVEVTITRPDGTTVAAELSGCAGECEDAEQVQVIARDITSRKHHESQLVHVASHDHLTGLLNRRSFEKELKRALAHAERSNTEGAVLWVDIDFFKEVNDTIGHRAGDELLIALTAVVLETSREESVVARIGGDEFAILLPGADEAEAERAAQRLVNEIRERTFDVDGHQIRSSVTAGLAVFPNHGTDSDEIMAHADVAMYVAKERGRGTYHVYSPGDAWKAKTRSRLIWTDRITRALSEDRMVLYAQPVVNLADGYTERFELLMRMATEDGALVMPGEFIGAAEEAGLIHEIDKWVIGQAIERIRRASTEGVELMLDVNISGKSCAEYGLCDSIGEMLLEARIDPEMLGLEITETAAVADISRAADFVKALRGLGCRFSLDDFGSGFSSFYYLRHLPIDTLKIDGSYIRGMATSSSDQHLVRAMVEMARGLNKRIVAECVEDEETLQILKEFGVDLAQGYYLRRPGPMEEVLAEVPDSLFGRSSA